MSPGGTAKSIPQKLWVKGNLVLFKQSQKLLLKRQPAMMLFLILDVMDYRIELREAHAKRTIFLLPIEKQVLGEVIMHPF